MCVEREPVCVQRKRLSWSSVRPLSRADDGPVCAVLNALTVLFAIFELTDVFAAIGEGVRPLTVEHAIFELTDVLAAILEGVRPLTVAHAIFELTDVLAAIFEGVRSIAVVLVPGHRAWWQRRLSGSNQRQQEQQ